MVKQFEDRVARLATLVEGWKRSGSVSHIERDLALDELRKLYDALLSAECDVPYRPAPLVAESQAVNNEPKVEVKEEVKVEVKEVPKPAVEPAPVVHKVDPIADFDDALDIDALLGLTDEDSESAPEPVAEPTPEPVVEPKPTPAPEPVVAPVPNPGGGLFAIEDIPVRSKSSRKMINLYNAPSASTPVRKPAPAPTPAPQPEPVYQQPAPQPAPTPVVEPMPVAGQVAPIDTPQPQRIGDVLGSGKKVVGDMQLQDNAPIAPMNKITDLRKAIGLNDKFLLLRDLFNGDVPLYERTIDTLNAFDDLDECLIYIVENFRWNPDSEGAKMLVSLIERKLS